MESAKSEVDLVHTMVLGLQEQLKEEVDLLRAFAHRAEVSSSTSDVPKGQ